ncbi:hypothetical protein VPH35_030351 [Triticum aestivum]
MCRRVSFSSSEEAVNCFGGESGPSRLGGRAWCGPLRPIPSTTVDRAAVTSPNWTNSFDRTHLHRHEKITIALDNLPIPSSSDWKAAVARSRAGRASMGPPPSRLPLLAALVAAALLAGAAAATEEAYVTLLYGDEFVLGVRVLGKSIRDTGTRRDMVVLVSDGVSEYSRQLLEADGWIVKRITLLANPNQVRPTRFWGVYTKLKIFNMTSYKKVVYLDADTVVVKSIEDVFKCGKFCGNLKHSERMNSGVMVVEPSETVFKDMISQVDRLPSYTGGDQGFLNSYYADFANSRVYEPDSPLTPEPETQRLSTLYNADVGLYMLANKWMVDEKELRVIHYTLGPLKPWDWWTAWLVKPVEIWQDVRQKLEESLPGTGGGRNPHDQLVVKFLFILPFCLLLFGYYQSCFQNNKDFPSVQSLCVFARRGRHKYKSEEALPSYSAVGVSSSTFSTSNQRVSYSSSTANIL